MAGRSPRILLPCAGASREVTLLVERTNHEWPVEARMSLLDVLQNVSGLEPRGARSGSLRRLELLDALKGAMS